MNSANPPADLLPLPFGFEGVLATVDATEIAGRYLKRKPSPVGITLLGPASPSRARSTFNGGGARP